MILAVEVGDDSAAVQGRRDERATLGQLPERRHRVLPVETRGKSLRCLGFAQAPGRVIRSDRRLVSRPGLQRIAEVFYRAQPCRGDLLDRQRHRDVRRGTEPAPGRFLDRVQENIGRERVIRDLDEIDPHLAQAVESRIDLRRRTDLDRSLPGRLVALELRPRREDGRAEHGAPGDGIAPFEHGRCHVGGGIAYGGDAVRHVERQQRTVLRDQCLAAAEMHVHVPEAGDHEPSAGVDRTRGAIAPGNSRVADRDDVAAPDDDAAFRIERPAADVDHGRRADQQIDVLRGLRGLRHQPRGTKQRGNREAWRPVSLCHLVSCGPPGAGFSPGNWCTAAACRSRPCAPARSPTEDRRGSCLRRGPAGPGSRPGP